MHSPEKWEIKRGVLRVETGLTVVVVSLADVHCVHIGPVEQKVAETIGPGFALQLVYASNGTTIAFDTRDEALDLADAITAFMVTGEAAWPRNSGGWDGQSLDAGVVVERKPKPLTDGAETGETPAH